MKAIGWLVFIARWERDDFTLLPTHLSVKRLTVIKKMRINVKRVEVECFLNSPA